MSAISIDQSNDSQLIDNGANNGISPIVDTPITDSVPVEDTPTQPTLIDALYTSNVDKKTVKRDQTKTANVLMKDGVDLRKYKRTAKVKTNYKFKARNNSWPLAIFRANS